MVEPTEDRELLRQMLQEYNEHPEQRQRIEGAIEEKFRRTVAVLVVDTSGFTRTTRLHGIVHFLALLERLTRAVTPVMVRCGGQFLKAEADSLRHLPRRRLRGYLRGGDLPGPRGRQPAAAGRR